MWQQKGEKRKGYPACRPSRRVSSKTPKTTKEMSSGEKTRFRKSKTSSVELTTTTNEENDDTPQPLLERCRKTQWLACYARHYSGIGAYATTGQSSNYSSPYDWKMTCDDFIMSKYSVLQDPHLDAQAKYKIISYLEQKLLVNVLNLYHNATSVHPSGHDDSSMEQGLGIWEITMTVTYVYRGVAYTKIIK